MPGPQSHTIAKLRREATHPSQGRNPSHIQRPKHGNPTPFGFFISLLLQVAHQPPHRGHPGSRLGDALPWQEEKATEQREGAGPTAAPHVVVCEQRHGGVEAGAASVTGSASVTEPAPGRAGEGTARQTNEETRRNLVRVPKSPPVFLQTVADRPRVAGDVAAEVATSTGTGTRTAGGVWADRPYQHSAIRILLGHRGQGQSSESETS